MDSTLEREMYFQIQAAGLPEPLLQFRPIKGRKYAVDFCFLDARLILEIEGGLGQAQSGHRSYSGVVRDIEKYNALTLAGWRVLRVTSDMVHDGRALALIERALGDSKNV
jgi:very-short-patch-repair endonuclease